MSDLRQRYPSSAAWEQAAVQEGAIVREPDSTIACPTIEKSSCVAGG